MAYDCINGWEDMIEALSLDLSAEGIDCDDAQEVATLALARIAELQRAETAARAMLAALLELLPVARAFERQASRGTGGRRGGRVFEKAAAAIAAAEAAGIES